jgi:hypothetical protein
MRHVYDDFYELVIVAGPFNVPSILNTTSDGVEAYATSDLFIQHPHRKDTWKIYGRADDQIMHSTGEKVGMTFHFYYRVLSKDLYRRIQGL